MHNCVSANLFLLSLDMDLTSARVSMIPVNKAIFRKNTLFHERVS
jgi:hypothetical protein